MKAHVLLLFVGLLLAVGYFTRIATEDDPLQAPRGKHRDGGTRSRFPTSGPFFRNVANFADDLGLTSEQRVRLEAMVKETTTEVRRREREIRDYVYATRDRVDTLLTDEQKQRLEDLNEKKWQEYRAARVRRSVAWFEDQSSVSADDRDRVAAVLTEYEEDKSKLFRSVDRRAPSADREGRREKMRSLAETRDRKLGEILAAEVLEKYMSAMEERRGFRSGRRNGKSRDGKHDGSGRDGRRGPGGRP